MNDVHLSQYFDGEGHPLYDGAWDDFVSACEAHHVHIPKPPSTPLTGVSIGDRDARTIGRPEPQRPIMFGGVRLPVLPITSDEIDVEAENRSMELRRDIARALEHEALDTSPAKDDDAEDDMQEFGASKVGQRVEGEDLEYLERSHWHHAEPTDAPTVRVPGTLVSFEEYGRSPIAPPPEHTEEAWRTE